jgi:SAM-dependent methyltransferase
VRDDGASARYTYGDSNLAGDRLAIVARTFEPATRSLLERVRPPEPRHLAVDLGCGPGHTTRLLHEVIAAEQTVGLDRSEAFVRRARAEAAAGVSFQVHDVTVVPFPTGAPDVAFCRLLLAHVPAAVAVVAAWARQLTNDGVLLLDEIESVRTSEGVIRAYLDEVAIPVVHAQGARLLAGPLLHAMGNPPGCERIVDEITVLEPPPAVSARIFAMNLSVLQDRGEVPHRPDLEQGLQAIAGGRNSRPIVWEMRQLAFRRQAD